MNTPDMQRARMSLPYYRENGWEPVVLTVSADVQDGVREPALMRTIPDDITIVRSGALPLKWCRFFGLGNLGLRSWFHLLLTGARILRREKIDLVFFSTTQFATFCLGRIWLRCLGVPYVIDLQDPWRTDYYERAGSRRPPGGWKYQAARFQARLLEPWALKRMAGFVAVSARYIDDLKARYRWFSRIPAEAIRFGVSEADLRAAQGLPSTRATATADKSAVRLVYTGAAGPITPRAAELLFGALQRFRRQQPGAAKRLRLEFIGTSYAASGAAQPALRELAEKFGVADQVSEVPERIGHLESLRVQSDADALLLLGSTDLAYSPSKLYPYYLSGRPILALVFSGSYLEEMVRELDCAFLVAVNASDPDDQCHENLAVFFSAALAGFPPEVLPRRNDRFFREQFLAPAVTARQCALFDRCLERLSTS
jgi:hypothetical protein